jgi:hypothetical protein
MQESEPSETNIKMSITERSNKDMSGLKIRVVKRKE